MGRGIKSVSADDVKRKLESLKLDIDDDEAKEFAQWLNKNSKEGDDWGKKFEEWRKVGGEILYGKNFHNKLSLSKSFTQAEKNIAIEAHQILNSEDFRKIVDAYKNKQDGVRIRINNRTISYDDAPFSGMTWFEENGFNIGREAFRNDIELVKTVLHELHRLNTSKLRGIGNASEVALETKNAFNFAEKAYKLFE